MPNDSYQRNDKIVGVPLTFEAVEYIDAKAKKERRTRAAVIRIWIEDAIQAEQTKQQTCNAVTNS